MELFIISADRSRLHHVHRMSCRATETSTHIHYAGGKVAKTFLQRVELIIYPATPTSPARSTYCIHCLKEDIEKCTKQVREYIKLPTPIIKIKN